MEKAAISWFLRIWLFLRGLFFFGHGLASFSQTVSGNHGSSDNSLPWTVQNGPLAKSQLLRSALCYTGKALSRQAAIEIKCHDHSTTAGTLGDFIVLKLFCYLFAASGALLSLSPWLPRASSAILLRQQPCYGTRTITQQTFS